MLAGGEADGAGKAVGRLLMEVRESEYPLAEKDRALVRNISLRIGIELTIIIVTETGIYRGRVKEAMKAPTGLILWKCFANTKEREGRTKLQPIPDADNIRNTRVCIYVYDERNVKHLHAKGR